MLTRLKKLRDLTGLRQADMAALMGLKQNAYSNIENGKNALTDRNASLLSEKLGIDKNWLLGEGKEEVPIDPDFLWSKLKNFLVPVNGTTINKSKSNPKLTECTASKRNLLETRPRIPYTAAAGSLTSAVEGVTAEQCEQIPRITAFPNYDFTIIIKGNSMEPKYEGGDEVACKRIDNTSFIQWGKVHVMDTAQGIIIKRIYEDDDKVRCVSYNPEYPDFSISKEEIYSMSLIVGLLRM